MVGHVLSALLVCGLLFCQLTHGANILAVFSYSMYSPFLVVEPYMKALARNGHQLTIISTGSYLADIDGAHHIRVNMLEQLKEDLLSYDFISFPLTKWTMSSVVSKFYYNSSNYILSDAGVQSLLHDTDAHFDMVIVQASLTDALYGFAKHYNASLVGISAYGTAWNIDYLAGNTAPSIYEPMSSEGYSRGFSLMDKFTNWIYITEEWLVERLIYLPNQVQLYKRYFNQSAESLYDIRHNFSLMLINHHFSLGRARSNVPNVIEVAGIHLNQPEVEMEASLQRFLDEAEYGVIFFSMGMEILNKWLPPTMIPVLLQCFAKLRQRVVWKNELETLPDMSDNIYLRPLLPQREILAHPNVKLFITHGGMLSIIEGAFNGVPMLCLPMYYDQFGNAELMKQSGAAKIHDIQGVTLESITESIMELLDNPIYTENAQKLAIRLRDQPMNPLDTAVWWTEYVLRHKGAPHMRLSERDISFMQYYNIDIISVLFGRIGLAIMILICVTLKLVIFVLEPFHMRLHVHLSS